MHQQVLSKTFVDFLNACKGHEVMLTPSVTSTVVIQGVLIDFDDTRLYLKDSYGLGCWLMSAFSGIEAGPKVMEVIDPETSSN